MGNACLQQQSIPIHHNNHPLILSVQVMIMRITSSLLQKPYPSPFLMLQKCSNGDCFPPVHKWSTCTLLDASFQKARVSCIHIQVNILAHLPVHIYLILEHMFLFLPYQMQEIHSSRSDFIKTNKLKSYDSPFQTKIRSVMADPSHVVAYLLHT